MHPQGPLVSVRDWNKLPCKLGRGSHFSSNGPIYIFNFIFLYTVFCFSVYVVNKKFFFNFFTYVCIFFMYYIFSYFDWQRWATIPLKKSNSLECKNFLYPFKKINLLEWEKFVILICKTNHFCKVLYLRRVSQDFDCYFLYCFFFSAQFWPLLFFIHLFETQISLSFHVWVKLSLYIT